MKVVAADALGELKSWAIILAFIVGPPLWVLLRKEDATDREGRGKAPPELDEPTSKKIGLPGIDYRWYSPMSEWDRLRKEKREGKDEG